MFETNDNIIKTQIIPINTLSVNNEFDVHLDTNIDIQGDTIGFVDLNLCSNINSNNEQIPIFNTIEQDETLAINGSLIDIPKGYYDLSTLLNKTGFKLKQEENNENNENIALLSYTYEQPKIFVVDSNNNKVKIYISAGRNQQSTIPNGKYTEQEYIEEIVWGMNSYWGSTASSRYCVDWSEFAYSIRLANSGETIHWINHDDTVGVFSTAHSFHFNTLASSISGDYNKYNYITFSNTNDKTICKQEWKFDRVVNFDVIEEGKNSIYMSCGPDDPKMFLITIPPGTYTQKSFYEEFCRQSSIAWPAIIQPGGIDTLDDWTEEHPFWYLQNEELNYVYLSNYDLEHSLMDYYGILHNLQTFKYFNSFTPMNMWDVQDGPMPKYTDYPEELKQWVPGYTPPINTTIIPTYHTYIDARFINFATCPQLREILGFTQEYYLNDDIKISENIANITGKKSVLQCHCSISDTTNNSLCCIPIRDPLGNNQFHDVLNSHVNVGTTHTDFLRFRFTDNLGNGIAIADNTKLLGFLELKDTVDCLEQPQTLKNLNLSCLTQDIDFETDFKDLNLINKTIKDIIIQNYSPTTTGQINSLFINNFQNPVCIFNTDQSFLYYNNVNSPISVNHFIKLLFKYPFKGNIICNICEPISIPRLFLDWDEIYCDFTNTNKLSFNIHKILRYSHAYLTNILVLSTDIKETDSSVVTLNCFPNKYQNIIHMIFPGELPYFYNSDQKYDCIKQYMKPNTYVCNRSMLSLLPSITSFEISCDVKCVILLKIQYN
ncbi:hypothetical protein WA158_003045 [Blastocystis sp. Blastoise]